MAVLFVPSALRKFAGGVERLEAGGATIGDVVAEVDRQFPGFAAAVTSGAGTLAASLQVFVDGEMAPEGLLAPVGASSEVHLLPAIAGGASEMPGSLTLPRGLL